MRALWLAAPVGVVYAYGVIGAALARALDDPEAVLWTPNERRVVALAWPLIVLTMVVGFVLLGSVRLFDSLGERLWKRR